MATLALIAVVGLLFAIHIGQNHDEPTGTTKAEIPIKTSRARITSIITRIGQSTPEIKEAPVSRGVLSSTLTENPVFIEAARR